MFFTEKENWAVSIILMLISTGIGLAISFATGFILSLFYYSILNEGIAFIITAITILIIYVLYIPLYGKIARYVVNRWG